MLGFETIGNATLVLFDGEPVLATDPWLGGSAYFGSWSIGYEVPATQIDHVKACKYIWYSHGHPDHLHSESMHALTGSEFLVPDHVGRRIFNDFQRLGLSVRIMPDRKWMQVSKNIRVMCISDFRQDALLLIDLGGKLIINANDCHPRGHDRFVKSISREFADRILMKAFGYGDIDMINLFAEDGSRIDPIPPRLKAKGGLAQQLQFWGRYYGATAIVPFSSFHAYQRTDSCWASEHAAPMSKFYEMGRRLGDIDITDPFIRYDVEKSDYTSLNPPSLDLVPKDPAEFGDDWNETLEPSDIPKITEYFQRIESLQDFIDFVRLKVGGEVVEVKLGSRNKGRGLQFEVPRNSLMTAVQFGVFDDLLIGNFMKTTFVGPWRQMNLDDFTPYVTRYGDNGNAFSKKELSEYMQHYARRAPVDLFMHRVGKYSERTFRNLIGRNEVALKYAKKAYLFVTRPTTR
jgi:hypothetical protein